MKMIPSVALLASGALLWLVTGCNRKTPQAEAIPSSTNTTIPGPIKLSIHYPATALSPEAWKEVLLQYQAQHSNVLVTAEAIPGSDADQLLHYDAKFRERSTEFDLFLGDVNWIGPFASAGWLRDLQNLVPVEERSDFFEGALAAGNWEQRLFAVPYFIDGTVLYARADLLQKNGTRLPKTWAELTRIAAEYNQKNPAEPVFGVLWPGQPPEEFVGTVLEFLWANNGQIFNYTKLVVNTPQNRTALGFVQGLMHRYKATPELVINAGPETLRPLFLEGKALFWRDWISQRGVLRTNDQVVWTALPGFAGHKPASSLDGWFLGINSRTRYVDASAQLLQYLISTQAMVSLVKASGQTPARPSLYKDREILDVHPDLEGLDKVFLQGRAFPVLAKSQQLRALLAAEFADLLAKTKTAEEVTARLQAQIPLLVNPGKLPPGTPASAQLGTSRSSPGLN